MAIPTATPVAAPEGGMIFIIDGELLLQIPPGVGSVNVFVSPRQIFDGPTIAAGPELTITEVVMLHPVGRV